MGGIHSVNKPEIFKANDDIAIFDDDVASLYPSIIIQNNIFPRHLGEDFVKIYKDIRNERIEAKRNGNKLKNETLKLAINGLTGNLQSKFS
jgi:DNA polymerase elongation subunit (family B)